MGKDKIMAGGLLLARKEHFKWDYVSCLGFMGGMLSFCEYFASTVAGSLFK